MPHIPAIHACLESSSPPSLLEELQSSARGNPPNDDSSVEARMPLLTLIKLSSHQRCFYAFQPTLLEGIWWDEKAYLDVGGLAASLLPVCQHCQCEQATFSERASLSVN